MIKEGWSSTWKIAFALNVNKAKLKQIEKRGKIRGNFLFFKTEMTISPSPKQNIFHSY